MARNNPSSRTKKSVKGKDQSSKSLVRSEESNTGLTRGELSQATPFAFMRRFSEEMDRLFEDFGFGRNLLAPGLARRLDQFGTFPEAAWAPQVEVLERDNQLIVRADLPGMTKDDVKVELDDNSLLIRGERKSEREEDDEGYYRSERSYGSFYRRIPLPQSVKTEEVSADFSNGVLEIKIPVPASAGERSRQIEITGGREEQPRLKAKAAGQKQ